MSRRMKILTIAISVSVIVLLAIGGVVLADDNRNCEKPLGPRMWAARGPGGVLSEVLGLTPEEIKTELKAGKTIEEMAAEQGLNQEQLKDAMTTAIAEKLQHKVAEGIITQEQADNMLQRMQNMPSPNLPPPFPHMGKMAPCGPNGLLSEVLGLTPEEIKAELKAGKTIAEIATEQGFTEAQLRDAMTAAIANQLQQKVAEGAITQDQADRMLQHMQDRSAENGKPAFGFGFRGHGRFPGRGGPCSPIK